MAFQTNDQRALICPICGNDFNHIVKVYTRMGIDPNEASVYDGTLGVGFTKDERRSCLVVELRCETAEHLWELRLQQHKGNVGIDSAIPG